MCGEGTMKAYELVSVCNHGVVTEPQHRQAVECFHHAADVSKIPLLPYSFLFRCNNCATTETVWTALFPCWAWAVQWRVVRPGHYLCWKYRKYLCTPCTCRRCVYVFFPHFYSSALFHSHSEILDRHQDQPTRQKTTADKKLQLHPV